MMRMKINQTGFVFYDIQAASKLCINREFNWLFYSGFDSESIL